MKTAATPFRAFLLVLMAAGVVVAGYFTPRAHTVQLVTVMTVIFACGIHLWRTTPNADVPRMVLAAFVLRLLLLVMWPNLSDDFYRFVWDGRLLAAGEQPFAQLPRALLHTPLATAADLSPELFARLNSPDYFTIYPPVAQFTFWLAAVFSPHSVWGSVLVLRVLQLLAEAGTLYVGLKLLERLQLPRRNVLLYAFNPLVILELTGNLHAEALLIFFLVAALYMLHTGRERTSAVLFGLSIAAKLVPLLLLPLLLRWLGWRRLLRYGCIAGGVVVVLFLPLLAGGFLPHLMSSVDLYFQKFEFNASVYYLVRAVGFAAKGYNIIAWAGPVLVCVPVVALVWFAFRRVVGAPQQVFYRQAALLLLVYYGCATIVHPWYITPLVALAVFAPLRFPLVWSVVAVLSYATYANASFAENYWLTALEYAAVVVAVVFDLRRQRATVLPVASSD